MSKSSLKQTLKDLDTKKISIRELNQDYLKRIKEKDNLNELDPNGGIIYVGNAEILKEICPGDFGKLDKHGYCMIGSR